MSTGASQDTEIKPNVASKTSSTTLPVKSTASSLVGDKSKAQEMEEPATASTDKALSFSPARRRRSAEGGMNGDPIKSSEAHDSTTTKKDSKRSGTITTSMDTSSINEEHGKGSKRDDSRDRSPDRHGARDRGQRRKSSGGDSYQQRQQASRSRSIDRRDPDRRNSKDQNNHHGSGHGDPATTARPHESKKRQHEPRQQQSSNKNITSHAKETKSTNTRTTAPQRGRGQSGKNELEPPTLPQQQQRREEATGSQAQESSSILAKPDPYSLLSITGKMGMLEPKKAFIGQSRVVDDFEKLNKVGEGTYGVVYRARDRKTKEIVALKRVRMERESDGLPISSLREIKLLKTLRHENVVLVKEVAVGSDLDQIFLVMEYCEQDMATLLDSIKTRYEPSEVKCLMYQLLKGIEYCHDRFVVHRDLKMSNLLLNAKGILKIADFGLARMYGTPTRPMTPKVVTLWYRSPELLFGDPNYTTAIDMWSAGCIFGELLQHSPLLPGKVEKQQVELIIELLGTPHEQIWQGFNKLPLSTVKLPEQRFNNLKNKFPNISDAALSLLSGLLTYDPKRRLTVKQALAHPYFIELPHAKHPSLLPTYPEIRNMKADDGPRGHTQVRGGEGGDRRDDSSRKRPAPQESRGGRRGGGGGGEGGGGERAHQKRAR